MPDLTGQVLADQYRVVEFLGRGGMAEVYKAWDDRRATHLALKLLLDDLAQDPVCFQRFKREAQTLSRLQHPNIVRFYGLLQDDVRAFMLMEYVEGASLREMIFRNQGKPFSNRQIIEIMQPVCAAVHYAHATGIVHCDLKPGNILIDKNGRVLVTDFGIARMSETATATMVGAGAPAYMAPEQILGENPTPQTDIYALGIVLYEMVTGGKRPFTGDSATTGGTTSERIRWEKLRLPARSPRAFNPEASEELEGVVLRCLEKDPQRRFASSRELLNAIERALSPAPRQPAHAMPYRAGSEPVQAERQPRWGLTRDSALVLLVFGFVFIAAAILLGTLLR